MHAEPGQHRLDPDPARKNDAARDPDRGRAVEPRSMSLRARCRDTGTPFIKGPQRSRSARDRPRRSDRRREAIGRGNGRHQEPCSQGPARLFRRARGDDRDRRPASRRFRSER